MRLTLLAFVLVAGEVAGFASGRMAAAWPWGAGVLALVALVAWGWKVPHVLLPLVFGLGMVVALRVEWERSTALEEHWRMGGNRMIPSLELAVEGPVEERELRKRGRVWQFFSHLGPTPLKVILPYAAGVKMPAEGEVWRCYGWVSRAEGRGGRFSRRVFWGRGGERKGVADSDRIGRTRVAFSLLGEKCARKAAVGLEWCPEMAALNQAILLGRRSDIPHARREIFVTAGTVHVFAISGLHVMLIAWMLANALMMAGVPVRLQGVLVLPVLVAYTLLTGARPSAIRATMMAGMYLLSSTVGRKGDSLVAWAVTALVVYGISPERVFDTGCTLSFAVMFGIVAWLKWARKVEPDSARRGWWVAAGVSLAAWAAGVPIAARVFGRFTLGGLLANLAVLRLAPLTVAFGMLGMLAAGYCEPVGILFNNLAAGSTFLMTATSALVAGLPASSLEVAPWTFTACAAWYVTVVGGLFLLGRVLVRRREQWWRRI